MNTLGFMTLNMNSEEDYLTNVAICALQDQIECVRFLPSSIDPLTQIVTGKKFEHSMQSWTECQFPIPAIIYDRCFYGDDLHSKQCIPIVSWLKSRADITFLGYGLPDKLEIYSALSSTEIGPYLPHSVAVSTSHTVLERLKTFSKLILKPTSGAQGFGIYFVEKRDAIYFVKTEKKENLITRTFSKKEEFIRWLDMLLKNRSYLCQPYFELSDEDSRPFDIRILLQKNESGHWVERGKGIRKGKLNGILSNLSAGGTITGFKEWVEAMPCDKKEYMSSELDYITEKIPHLLEKKFMPLFELGLDIGVARDGSLWLLDINSKPGRKVILATNPELREVLYSAPLHYAKFISQSNMKGGKKYYEKTLYY